MKVALARDGDMIAPHFGRCERYEIVEIADGEVTERETIPNPGHEPGALPKMLNGIGVDAIVAGGMGPRAQELFDEFGIQTVTGVSGGLNEIIEAIAWGKLDADGGNICHHA